jgi:heme/copper-type cytochrome/quinol oxidase subunit 2
METIIVEIGKFINTYIVWIIIFIFIMFIISLVCFANYDDDTSYNEVDNRQIYLFIWINILLVSMLISFSYAGEIKLEKMKEQHHQQYIHKITDFDRTAPAGMYIVKRYKNMEDFKHYKVYGEDAGYTLYKVDNKGSVVEVTFKKND